jgi:hypothetical protein
MEYKLCGVVRVVSNSSDGFSSDGGRDARDYEMRKDGGDTRCVALFGAGIHSGICLA